MIASLAVALCAHLLLLLIPVYRLIGTHPGNSGGTGGVSNRFTGALLGSSVVIRTPETTRDAPETESVASQDQSAPPAQITVSRATQESAAAIEELDSNSLAVEVIPPTSRSGSASQNHNGALNATGANFGGSLKPLGGGGGATIEMDLSPKRIVWPDPLDQIVHKRKIYGEVIVQVLVDIDGLVIDHRVLRSLPKCPECTSEAVQVSLRHEFPGPVYDGERIRAWVKLTWTFGSPR